MLAAAMLAWNPHVGDLAAQVFRTELFQDGGLGIWNGSWYGGHYTLTYSVLFPPLAALLGPRTVGVLAVIASAYLFDRLVRDRWGDSARWATLWFAAGVVTLLADGQLTFALGAVFGLATLRAMQRRHPAAALALAAACALSSPVAAVFLAGVLVAGSVELPRRRRPARAQAHPIQVACVAFGLVLIPNLLFPGTGQFPFVFSSYAAVPLWCGSALYLTRNLREEERQLRQVLIAYTLAATALWLLPNAMGGNAVRLGALFGGPVLAAVLLARRPRAPIWFVALFLAGSLYWQFNASVTQIARSVGDPSTQSAYFQPLAHWLRADGGEGARIEVPPTANHWESAYLSPEFELARGWLRQIDTTRDDIFYDDDGNLTSSQYRAWLHDNAVRFVALPDAPLDYSSVAERRLILSEPSYLRLRWHSAHWRVYSVLDQAPLVQAEGGAAARVLQVGRQGFTLDVTHPGDFLVRVSFTPYWSIGRGRGCLLRRGEWTVARAESPGVFHVGADFSLARAWNAVTGARKTC
ncbi:MAG TPA: hypothetical protein VGF09_07635 [Solirubrobacterales bacterium]